ncbi:uncharacterized protein HMPREF1541_09641 [Cyphellophora europaea CBS 101466]|uniref:NAD-dependent epimerase/dehydratase domain-containing protein n=1 Tax=Cyphellophora europaea (strain CBS 101466) TaxID=1220924 RepID=W2SCQ0_CYPE1|nr:uncharacterized protein HMPREF1541_09641 [Cyphellophora europaea CBS 101466]ETN45808.1 hypothetical protein HMPREF1541_09641 [Cyphellophora europaea CBS 101466]
MEIAKRRVHILFHNHLKPIVRKMSLTTSSSNSSVELALPKGSLILVTGATGYIASHIIKEALDLGYRVRGITRSKAKAELIEAAINDADFSTCIVEDFSNSAALEEAVKDCLGIIHTASVTSLSPDPEKVIPPTVGMASAILTAAKRVNMCRRFVFTSSSSAVWIPKPDTPFKIGKNTWNQDSVQKVQSMTPPFKAEGFYDVIAASKVQAEQAVWRFVEEEKPDFVVNTIVPNTNIGRVIVRPATSSANFALAVLNGSIQRIATVPPQWMINTSDDARIHLAALIDRNVSNERIFAFAQPFDWNEMREAVLKARPNASVGGPLPPHGRDVSEVDNTLGEELLKRWFSQDGYKLLDESVRENLEGYGEPDPER